MTDAGTTGSTTTSTVGVWPAFQYADAPAAIAFLVDVLGFTESVRFADGDTVHHAELRGPAGGGVMLGTRRDGSPLSEMPPASGAAYLFCPDPDELYARARRAGARIVRELEDTDYGSREFAVADPEGVVWSVGTYAGHGHGG
jgi:uncharacterized glyoxalase superfamily protein PhnB